MLSNYFFDKDILIGQYWVQYIPKKLLLLKMIPGLLNTYLI